MAICVASVHAQDAAPELQTVSTAASPLTQESQAPAVKVRRYSAGESIPLGLPQAVKEQPQTAVVPAVPVMPVVRYSAGESIVLGLPQQPAAGVKELSPTEVVRYSAGDSIPLGLPAPGHSPADVYAKARRGGYSAASDIPLAGALGDSVSTHIGLSQTGLAEKNTLINTSPAGLLGLFVIKAGIVYYFDQQKPAVRKSGLKTTAGVWSGVTMNNLLLIAGTSSPVGLLGGALFGAYMYQREGKVLEQEEAKAARRALVQAK